MLDGQIPLSEGASSWVVVLFSAQDAAYCLYIESLHFISFGI